MDGLIIRIDCLELESGMEIAEDIFTSQGTLILGKGTILNEKMISRLILLGLKDIPIIKGQKKEIQSLNLGEASFQEAYKQQMSLAQEKLIGIKEGEKIDKGEIFTISKKLVDNLKDASEVIKGIGNLNFSSNPIYTHSLNVALICYLFTKWFNFIDELAKELVTAGFLHDLGKIISPEEYEKHPIVGTKFLADHGASKAIQMGVLMHHEKEDGSGFPTKARWWSIHPFAKIISIANYYDNHTTGGKKLQENICPFNFIRIMENERYGHFDIRYMDIFLNKIANYYLGELVRLTDGRIGRVIFINKHCLSKPIVQVGEDLIDLYGEENLKIKEIV